MSDARRKTMAATVAVVMHGSMMLGGACVPKPLDFELDIEWELTEVELLDPDAIQGTDVNAEPVPPEPEPPEPEQPPQPETPPEPEPPKPEEAKPDEPVVDEGPKRDLGKRKSKVSKLGPPSAKYHFLLSTKNIRRLPFAESAMSVVAPFPDFKYLIEKGGFDPLRDFDHILIASSNIRVVQETFLAVDYKISREAVKSKIEAAARASRESIEWREQGGVLIGDPKPLGDEKDRDPRQFVLLEKKLALFVQPKFLPAILNEDSGEEKTSANFVGELSKLRRYARRLPTTGVQFVAHDLHAALKRKSVGPFDLPNEFEFTMEARKTPEFHVRAKFAAVSDAKSALDAWNGPIREFILGNLAWKIAVGSIIDDVEVEQNGREVTMWGELERKQVELLLQSAASQTKKEQERVQKLARKRRAAAKKKAAEGEGKAGAEP